MLPWPLAAVLAGLLVLVAYFTVPQTGAATRHWVAAAQPPAVCVTGGRR